MNRQKIYMCIDLKSYYASVECVERGLDPMTTDLVVADPTRTERTICLAVSPSLKAKGVRNRCRVYEIPKGMTYIMAPPRMNKYMEYSARIYGVYLKYVSKEDIHVYSIDEAFLDVTSYMAAWGDTPKDFAKRIISDIKNTTGITATCGIGTNLFLAKVALDIVAKHAEDYIGVLTEKSFQEQLWDHRPITDFWMIGHGTENRLGRMGIQTLREVTQCNEKYLYKAFGINAELLIDHAWGRESTSIADIKAYKPKLNSLSSSQVLHEGYDIPGTKLLVLEMAELLSLDLVAKDLCTNSITIYLAYSYTADMRPAHGTISTGPFTSSTKKILEFVAALYDRIAVYDILVYQVGICFNNLQPETSWQYDIFSPAVSQEKEKRLQKTIIGIKEKYGRNGIVKGMNLLEGAKTVERNAQVGGHRAE